MGAWEKARLWVGVEACKCVGRMGARGSGFEGVRGFGRVEGDGGGMGTGGVGAGLRGCEAVVEGLGGGGGREAVRGRL